jgi:hypothetical protein
MIPKHSIISYVRNRKGNPVGILVASKHKKSFKVGYSLCCKKDRFSREMGLKIAFGRSEAGSDEAVPHIIRRALPEFAERCRRYYKVAKKVATNKKALKKKAPMKSATKKKPSGKKKAAGRK